MAMESGRVSKRGKMSLNEGGLIPGLVDDVGALCLLRVPRSHHPVLRCVNSAWRDFVGSASFHNQRLRLGLTKTRLFLSPSRPRCDQKAGPVEVPCLKLDLGSLRTSQSVLHIDSAPSAESVLWWMGRVFQWCADSHCYVDDVSAFRGREDYTIMAGPGTLALGCDNFSCLLNTQPCVEWWQARQYGERRGSFIWSTGDLPEDILPLHMSFVHNGRLFAMGSHKAFSYGPLEGRWQPEPWWTELYQTIPVADLGGRHHMVATADGASVYFLEDNLTQLKIFKHDKNNDGKSPKWRHLLSIPNNCPRCHHRATAYNYPRYLGKFCGLKHKLLVMEHLEGARQDEQVDAYNMNVKVTQGDEVIRVAVKCPSECWTCMVES